MKLSASIELVWQLASQEAIASEWKEIEPDHFFEALLKFAELPVDEVDKIAPGAEVAKALAAEVSAVRNELAARPVDTTRVRRELRARLGKGNAHYDGGQMHRSQASRDLFDAAAKVADDSRSETVMPVHLLGALMGSPTPAMAQVLGGAAGERSPKPSKTPLLDAHGQDLTALAAEGKLAADRARQAECKALLGALAEKGGKSVLLVCESRDAARAVVVAGACAMAAKGAPPGLKGKRIVDLAALKPVGKGAAERMEGLLGEASRAPEVILFLPGIEGGEEESQRDWPERLKAALAKGGVQCICRAEPKAFGDLIRGDRSWKAIARVMWIREEGTGDVPAEL